MKDKVVGADEAVALIRDGDAVSCSGFVGTGTPDALIAALERRYLAGGRRGACRWYLLRRPVMAEIGGSTG